MCSMLLCLGNVRSTVFAHNWVLSIGWHKFDTYRLIIIYNLLCSTHRSFERWTFVPCNLFFFLISSSKSASAASGCRKQALVKWIENKLYLFSWFDVIDDVWAHGALDTDLRSGLSPLGVCISTISNAFFHHSYQLFFRLWFLLNNKIFFSEKQFPELSNLAAHSTIQTLKTVEFNQISQNNRLSNGLEEKDATTYPDRPPNRYLMYAGFFCSLAIFLWNIRSTQLNWNLWLIIT